MLIKLLALVLHFLASSFADSTFGRTVEQSVGRS